MIDSNNILLITDYEEVATSILKKLVLLRKNDNISVTNIKNLKKHLKTLYIVLLSCMKPKTKTQQLKRLRI